MPSISEQGSKDVQANANTCQGAGTMSAVTTWLTGTLTGAQWLGQGGEVESQRRGVPAAAGLLWRH